MATHYNSRIARSGLMLQLDAGNTKRYPGRGTTWSDISGQSNTCTLVDGPTYSNGTISFDGTANRGHVSSPSGKFSWTPDTTFNQAYTFDIWVKTSDTSGYILSKPWNGAGQYNYRVSANSFNIESGATIDSILLPASVSSGAWVNVVCWVNAANMGYYVNSTTSSSKAHVCTGNIPSGGNINGEVCLMSLYPYSSGWAGNTAFSIVGNLASVRIYNKVLTAAEVDQNFNAMRWRFNV